MGPEDDNDRLYIIISTNPYELIKRECNELGIPLDKTAAISLKDTPTDTNPGFCQAFCLPYDDMTGVSISVQKIFDTIPDSVETYLFTLQLTQIKVLNQQDRVYRLFSHLSDDFDIDRMFTSTDLTDVSSRFNSLFDPIEDFEDLHTPTEDSVDSDDSAGDENENADE